MCLDVRRRGIRNPEYERTWDSHHWLWRWRKGAMTEACSGPCKLGRKQTALPPDSPERSTALDWCWWDLCCASGPQNLKIMHLCSFKLLGLWVLLWGQEKTNKADLSGFFPEGGNEDFFSLNIELDVPGVGSPVTGTFQSLWGHACWNKGEKVAMKEHSIWSLFVFSSLSVSVLFLQVKHRHRWAQVPFGLKLLKLLDARRWNKIKCITIQHSLFSGEDEEGNGKAHAGIVVKHRNWVLSIKPECRLTLNALFRNIPEH